MGRTRRPRAIPRVKRMVSQKDPRLAENQKKDEEKKKAEDEKQLTRVDAHPSSLFFQYNTSLGPPYYVLIDTNFINFTLKNKMDMVNCMMDCLFGKCIPCVTDCVLAELEKLGRKFRLALRLAKDPRFERLPCSHKGTYADDCLVDRVTQHRVYIVGTMDKDLKRRLREVPGVPIMYIKEHKYAIERMPDSHGGLSK
eukprot:TRINITY_DN4879_c1_g1_i1.p2 TRINITY_DN4879_c1_g1~~TRINITY_DN4879_c1_g1_i1.p2  ORF type:complete len:197 (+),score=38.68 TRINITY_DN4879_c1_g1_i1:315-905(+)